MWIWMKRGGMICQGRGFMISICKLLVREIGRGKGKGKGRMLGTFASVYILSKLVGIKMQARKH